MGFIKDLLEKQSEEASKKAEESKDVGSGAQ
jgi:hypothetical protein